MLERLGLSREKAEDVVGKVLDAEVLLRELASQFSQGKSGACDTAIAGKPAPTIDRISKLERGHCGSWLACDESNSVYLPGELAREKPENTAGRQAPRVIVDVFREQARSYRCYFFSSASNTWSTPEPDHQCRVALDLDRLVLNPRHERQLLVLRLHRGEAVGGILEGNRESRRRVDT